MKPKCNLKFLFSTTIFLVILINNINAQSLGKTNLSRYSNIGVFVDLDTEIPNTFLQTPITSNTVANYLIGQLQSNGVPCSIKSSNQGTPLMRVRLTTFSLQVGECSVTSLSIACFIYEDYAGKRFISWNWDNPYLTINLKADGKAAGVWECLGKLVEDFASEWRQSH